MSIAALTQTIEELNTCIEWVKSLIPDLRPSWRYFHYREVLVRMSERTADGVSMQVPQNELTPVLEAYNSVDNLRSIHRKFKDRSDRIFVTKLREATYGPRYRFQEVEGQGMQAMGDHGRNTEAELCFAAMHKDQKLISFDSADFTVTTPSFKIGIEVKRPKSPTKIVSLYVNGAKQIQKNQNIEWGFIMIRLDRLLYSNKRNGLFLTEPLLDKRTVAGMKYDHEQQIEEFCFHQVKWFQDEFGPLFLAATKDGNYTKSLGFGIYLNMPFAIGNPPNLMNKGAIKFVRWGSKNPGDDRDRAIEEFLGTLEEQNIRTIKKPSTIILLN
jgi:hypothetical protein